MLTFNETFIRRKLIRTSSSNVQNDKLERAFFCNLVQKYKYSHVLLEILSTSMFCYYMT